MALLRLIMARKMMMTTMVMMIMMTNLKVKIKLAFYLLVCFDVYVDRVIINIKTKKVLCYLFCFHSSTWIRFVFLSLFFFLMMYYILKIHHRFDFLLVLVLFFLFFVSVFSSCICSYCDCLAYIKKPT